MAAQDIAIMAIITPFGLFEYLFMPFSLHNAAQTFQRFMDRLFKHLPFVFCYLDDLIANRTLEEHQELRRSLPSFRRTACRSTRRSGCLPPSPWSSWATGWTSTASSRSSCTCRPLVNFLPFRM
jgi:hypothetical protein